MRCFGSEAGLASSDRARPDLHFCYPSTILSLFKVKEFFMTLALPNRDEPLCPPPVLQELHHLHVHCFATIFSWSKSNDCSGPSRAGRAAATPFVEQTFCHCTSSYRPPNSCQSSHPLFTLPNEQHARCSTPSCANMPHR